MRQRYASSFFTVMVSLTAIWLIMASPTLAQTFNVQVAFNGSNGGFPQFMSLVQGRDGNYYGTAASGGAYGNGTVFQLTRAGILTTLHDFMGGHCRYGVSDAGPGSQGLVLAKDGTFYGTTALGSSCTCDNGYECDCDNCGTIFSIGSSIGSPYRLYGFCHVTYDSGPTFFYDCDPGGPNPGLIQAGDGNFYGTTALTVFKVTPAGKETVLYRFCSLPNCADGFAPNAGLVQTADGYFYGTTSVQGAHGDGTVFKIDATGKLTTLYNFCSLPNCADGASPSAPLIQAADGNLYGTTPVGGASGSGTVFKVTSTGKLTTLYSFCSLPNCADGALPSSSLLQATDGNFYGVTQVGGDQNCFADADGCGTVFKITPSGTLTTLHSFEYSLDGGFPLGGLLQATDGNFYGTTTQGGDPTCACGTVFSLSMGLSPFVSLLPTKGKVGQTIGLLGQGFTSATSVTFGSAPASFNIVSDTYLTAVVPAEGTTSHVTVTYNSGTLTSNTVFRVVPIMTSYTPTSGPPGTQVTITGGGFRGTNLVTFGGVKAIFTVDSSSQITAIVPTGAVTGHILITTPGGAATSREPFPVQ
jgi:uncharacterized repeat protein (TIGR03803 family)